MGPGPVFAEAAETHGSPPRPPVVAASVPAVWLHHSNLCTLILNSDVYNYNLEKDATHKTNFGLK